MAAMRWLLIALVLLLQVQAPAVADAAPVAASCHELATGEPAMHHGEASVDAPDDVPGAEGAQHRAHLCPGCSIPGIAPLIHPQAEITACPPAAGPLARLESLSLRPSLRPPRPA